MSSDSIFGRSQICLLIWAHNHLDSLSRQLRITPRSKAILFQFKIVRTTQTHSRNSNILIWLTGYAILNLRRRAQRLLYIFLQSNRWLGAEIIKTLAALHLDNICRNICFVCKCGVSVLNLLRGPTRQKPVKKFLVIVHKSMTWIRILAQGLWWSVARQNFNIFTLVWLAL